MTSASALVDTVALLLLRNVKEGLENGRIADIETVQTEVESAMAQLSRRQLLDEPTHTNELVAKLLVEIGSLHERVARFESQLTECHSRVQALEENDKQNDKVITSIEGAKANISTAQTPCPAPAPTPTDLIVRPAPSRMAVVSFPGGPRTITIHPPGSPNYQSTIRDENGDVIVTLKAPKQLRREGAFIGPLEEIDWVEIHRVYGRCPEIGSLRAVPPVPRWPDHSQPYHCLSPRSPGGIIARQRQLSLSMQTDAFGRVLGPDYLITARSPSLPTGMSSSSFFDLRSFSGTAPEIIITPSSTPSSPSSPSVGRGNKRARPSEEDEGMPPDSEGAAPSIDPPTAEGHKGLLQPEERPRRKRPRFTRTGPLARTHSVLDVTRTV